jgi:DnaJ-class molecular chaperone
MTDRLADPNWCKRPESEPEKCPTCYGRGEVWAEAPWARWFDCGDCKGTGLRDPNWCNDLCDECSGRGFHVGPICCGNLIDGDCRGDCAVPEQVPCSECGGTGRVLPDSNWCKRL